MNKNIELPVYPVKYDNFTLKVLDQTKLPIKEEYLNLSSLEEIAEAIEKLIIRGAPLIGIAAAYGLIIGLKEIYLKKINDIDNAWKFVIERLSKTRPTAVNLFWALDKMTNRFNTLSNEKNNTNKFNFILEELEKEAIAIHYDDYERCQKIGEHGIKLINKNDNIMTICNAGILATGGMGTALSPIYKSHFDGYGINVYSLETRPLQQGSRLTCWELQKAGVPVTLITDGMIAYTIQKKDIKLAITGADRVVKYGAAANKIGTFNLAIVCKYFNIPFYIAAPLSTFDLSINIGIDIPIEERNPDEVRNCMGNRTAPEDINVFNPAFDVVPPHLISGYITEKGIFQSPFSDDILNV